MADWKSFWVWDIDYLAKNFNDTNIMIDWVANQNDSLMVLFKHYVEYFKFNKDDDPIVLRDEDFGFRHKTKPLIRHYTRPSFFGEDVLSYLAESKRYGYRSLNIAPIRSGHGPKQEEILRNIWEG